MQRADYRVIPLVKRGEKVGETLVDAEDYDQLARWRWVPDKSGYAVHEQYVLGSGAAHRRKIIYRVHRVVMGLAPSVREDPRQADHINGDRLDNRKANLRVVSHAEQAQNRTHFNRGISRFRGVHWHVRPQKWAARVTVGNTPHHLGYFTDEIEAALAAHAGRLEFLPLAEPDPFLIELGLIDGR